MASESAASGGRRQVDRAPTCAGTWRRASPDGGARATGARTALHAPAARHLQKQSSRATLQVARLDSRRRGSEVCPEPRRLLVRYGFLLQRALVVEPQADANRSRLIGQIPHAGAGPALTIECQKGSLVRDVVDEERRLPVRARHSGSQIDQGVRGQQRIECEELLCVRTA